MMINTHKVRRKVLKQFGAIAAASPFAANLALVGSAAAQNTTGNNADYKALVCVFLNGGNDQSNTIVPLNGAAYQNYAAARLTLTLPQAKLSALAPLGYNGAPLAMPTELSALKSLFDAGQCALLANVGTLVQPTSLAQWNNGNPTVALPYQLFSHSDQANSWQTGLPNRVSQSGWLGRAGDLLAPAFNSSALSICMSIAGNNVIQTGAQTIQYQLSTQGAIKVDDLGTVMGSAKAGAALRQLLTEPRTHLLEKQLNKTATRAIASEAIVSAALANVTVNTVFPNTKLGAQLKMAARMIGARVALGQTRQIFYVSAGGYDFHDNLIVDHALRLRELAEALAAFYAATVELGVAQKVTSFTASDFGRALQSNGRGSDHGWGGHHFIVGSAVKGNRIYGTMPEIVLKGPQDVGQGRLLPSTAVDEYASTLALWFGVTPAQLETVLPNIGRFPTTNLGFLG
jgi:uncharacterized protein (DUF1501 family)